MTNTKHTPAPWIADGITVKTEHGATITDADFVSFNREVSKANARLIAAAPDLLYALKRMVTRFEDYINELEAETGEEDETFKAALEAIAKAGGK